MPPYRLLWPNCRTGQRIGLLTDLEYLVWEAYLLSADDFGVCPNSAAKLQGDTPRIEEYSKRRIEKCIATIVSVHLLYTFVDGKTPYLYQKDWRDWQQFQYPSVKTSYPPIPDRLLMDCSPKTQELFREFHPKIIGKPYTHSDVLSTETETEPKTEPKTSGSLIVSSLEAERARKSFAFFGSRLRVPHVLHREFRTKLGGVDAETRLQAWYLELNTAADESQEPILDVFTWLRPKFVEWGQRALDDVAKAKFLALVEGGHGR